MKTMLKFDPGLRLSNLKKFYNLKISLKILPLVVEICQRIHYDFLNMIRIIIYDVLNDHLEYLAYSY